MKINKTGVAVLLISVGVLSACGDNEDQSAEDMPTSGSEQRDTNNQVEGSSEGLTEKIDPSSDDEETEKDSSPNLGEGTTEDQLDLRIGDTGQIETSLNMFELTVNSVDMMDDINGETPEREKLILTDVTLKNLSDTMMDISEALDVMEITVNLEGSGSPDFAKYYDSVETLEGQLESEEEIKGQLVFEENVRDEYFIRVSEGLIAAGGAKNQAIWTFTKDEAE
ncbi:hypothetical protein MKY91_03090 [Alkalicoccobacillus gibsonii]|uniref:DUF4352 domain-containing protein n=1 Tax=Alkalicoccobacillus gibsonii TaxID=79881 RepID=A0ABU9VET0_9BACI